MPRRGLHVTGATPRGLAAAVLSAAMLVAYSLDPTRTWLLWAGMAGFMVITAMWGLAESAAVAASAARYVIAPAGHPRHGAFDVVVEATSPAGLPPAVYEVVPSAEPPAVVLDGPRPVFSPFSKRAEWRFRAYAPPGEWCFALKAVRVSDTLGFFVRLAEPAGAVGCVHVAPRAAVAGRVVAEAAGLVLGRPAGRVGAGTSFLYIREYEPGDDLRRIEWKASARTGRLAVKVMEREEHASLAVLLALSPASLSAPPGLTPYEHAVEAVAALAGALASAGSRVTLVVCAGGQPVAVDARTPAAVAGALSKVKPSLDEAAWLECVEGLKGLRVLSPGTPRRARALVAIGDRAGVEAALEAAAGAGWAMAVPIAWRGGSGVVDSASSPITTALRALRGLARSMRSVAA